MTLDNTYEFTLIYELHQLVAVEINGDRIKLDLAVEFDKEDYYIHAQSAPADDWKRMLFGNYTVTWRAYTKAINEDGEIVRLAWTDGMRMFGNPKGIIGTLV